MTTIAGEDPSEIYDLAPECTAEELEAGQYYIGTVNGVVDFGVFVDLSAAVSGLVHESNITGEYSVGDELVVELENRREDGDLSFEEVGIDPAEYPIVTIEHDPDLTPVLDLPESAGEQVYIAGELTQIKQTGGPTLFYVSDGTGVAPVAAFEDPGVRAHPDLERGDIVRVSGVVERHDDGYQIESTTVEPLTGDQRQDAEDHLAERKTTVGEPPQIDPLVEWEPMAALFPKLEELATQLRRAVLEGRPIKIRHHADGDGMCASVPVQLALERFIDTRHLDSAASHHLLRRHPSTAPFYEMEDVTRDLSYGLADQRKHGQQLPLLLMLDNGSTEEDAPAYETLRHYDAPIHVVDHHHPDVEAVESLVDTHVNPYLNGDDYRVTTGMMCVELARMIAPGIGEELEHVPAVAGLSDRSEASAMTEYLSLAADAGYEQEDLKAIGDALDYLAHHLRYDAGRELVEDALGVGADETTHRELVAVLSKQAREDIDEQVTAALPHVESRELDNGATLYQLDVEEHAHRFTYPAPGTTTGAIHDHFVETEGTPAITIGYGPDFAVLRSDGVRLDIPTMVTELDAEIAGGGVHGGGHLVVGSVKYLPGRREEVLQTLINKMAAADVDESVGTTTDIIET